jgi:hypothetical protein
MYQVVYSLWKKFLRLFKFPKRSVRRNDHDTIDRIYRLTGRNIPAEDVYYVMSVIYIAGLRFLNCYPNHVEVASAVSLSMIFRRLQSRGSVGAMPVLSLAWSDRTAHLCSASTDQPANLLAAR